MSTENTEKLNFSSVWPRVIEVVGNISKKQIAEMAGVTAAAVTNWETTGKIPHEPLFRIALVNGVSVHWFLTGDGEKYVSPAKDRSLFRSDIERAIDLLNEDKLRNLHLPSDNGNIYEALLYVARSVESIQRELRDVRVFISHSSDDSQAVREFIELFEKFVTPVTKKLANGDEQEKIAADFISLFHNLPDEAKAAISTRLVTEIAGYSNRPNEVKKTEPIVEQKNFLMSDSQGRNAGTKRLPKAIQKDIDDAQAFVETEIQKKRKH